jgi:hypothetical protein
MFTGQTLPYQRVRIVDKLSANSFRRFAFEHQRYPVQFVHVPTGKDARIFLLQGQREVRVAFEVRQFAVFAVFQQKQKYFPVQAVEQ